MQRPRAPGAPHQRAPRPQGPRPMVSDEKPTVHKQDPMAEVQQGKEQQLSIGGYMAPVPIGRGAVRGRRQIDLEHYRAKKPQSSLGDIGKQGTSRQPVKLMANYFPITSYTNWSLNQYRVDFNPEEDRISTKRGLLAQDREQLGGYLFDGTMLFSEKRFDPPVFELTSTRRTDDQIVGNTVELRPRAPGASHQRAPRPQGPRPMVSDEKPTVHKQDPMAEVQQGKEQQLSIGGYMAPVPIGRGAVRGRRQIDLEHYRAKKPQSSLGDIGKQGTSRQPVKLMANYFPITSYTNWSLNQYRVDFNPEEDRISTKRGLLAQDREQLGGYLFDGTMLFSEKRFDPPVFELTSTRRTDDQIVGNTVELRPRAPGASHQRAPRPQGPRPMVSDEKPTVHKQDPMAEVQQGKEQQLSIGGYMAPVPIGRGAVRGRRQIDLEHYRAKKPQSSLGDIGKQGTSGQPVKLLANYFPITSYPNWSLNQYRVDFNPEEDRISTKRGLLAQDREQLGGYLFDGTMLFSEKRFDPPVFELTSTRRTDDQIVGNTVELRPRAPGASHQRAPRPQGPRPMVSDEKPTVHKQGPMAEVRQGKEQQMSIGGDMAPVPIGRGAVGGRRQIDLEHYREKRPQSSKSSITT